MESVRKKTPTDTTEFEREQLRFFLSGSQVSERLADLNPSLAWLPEFLKMKIIQEPGQLARWIEKNFTDYNAIREVATNIDFFDTATANLLELSLNRQLDHLPQLLTKCWYLIIRYIRD